MPSGQDVDQNGTETPLPSVDCDVDSPESGEIDGASMDSILNSYTHTRRYTVAYFSEFLINSAFAWERI